MILLNPVMRRELVAILETKKAYVFTALYLSASAVIVYMGWPEGERVLRGARVSRHLFETFCLTQLVVLGVMMPALSAPVLTREKENESYDFLIATPLNKRALLLGKLSPSLVFAVLLLVGVFPMMSACTLLGGLPFSELLGGNLVLLCSALLFASIGCFFSALFERTQAALAASYMVVLPLSMGAALLLWNRDLLANFMFPPFVLFLSLSSCMFLLGAVIFMLARPRDPAPPIDREVVQIPLGLQLSRENYPDRLFLPRELTRPRSDRMNALADKELRSELFGRGTRWVRLAIQISVILSVFFLVPVATGYAAAYSSFLLAFIILMGGSLAAPTWSQERERKTLGSLTVTLVRPSRILWAKYRTPFWVTVVLTSFLLIPALPAYLLVTWHTSGSIKTILMTLSILVFALAAADLVVSAGNFFSAGAATTAIALVRTYAFLAIFFAGPLLLRLSLVVILGESGPELDWLKYFSPFDAFANAIFSQMSLEGWRMDTALTLPYCTNVAAMLICGFLFKAVLHIRYESMIERSV